MVRELMKFGLTEKESEIYLACVSLGNTTVQNISKKANVNRVTTYAMIDQLSKKGLMSSFTRGKKKLYVAEKPERMLAILQEKEAEAQQTIKRFTEILPELHLIIGQSGTKPVVRFYEGVEGIKTIHELMHKTNAKDFYHVEVARMSSGIFPPGTSKYRDASVQKVLKGERNLHIVSVGPSPWREHFYKDTKNHDIRYISQEKYPFMFEFGIYGHMVVLYLQKGDYMGIVIEDDEVAKNFKMIFQFMWDHGTKKYQD